MKKIVLFIVYLTIHFNVVAQQDAWIYLIDKLNVQAAINNPISILTQKSIDRKQKYGISIDQQDVPVNENYISQLKNATGITVMAKSKWFNAVHVRGTQESIQALEDLSFVSNVEFANKNLNTTKAAKQKRISKKEAAATTFNYGNALNQIKMFNGDVLHEANYTGEGITVALMDSGFPNVNTMSAFQKLRDTGHLLDGYDFVNRTSNIYANTASNHGTLVLSTMAGFIQDQFVGTAPNASYYLFITEDAASENPVEESYWVEAVERADSLGVDVINTSLGYTTYDNANYSYSPSDMDGDTAFITKGANKAFEKGLLLVNSAGNSGNNTWGIVGAPADAQGVLSIGAVNASGTYASFSSMGNATQPSQKPDIVAQGLASYVITENDVITTFNGTSFSSPIIAGGIVCLKQALPDKTPLEIMQLVRASASQYEMPDYFLGYGIPDLEAILDQELSTTSYKKEVNNSYVYPNPFKDKINFITPPDQNVLAIHIYDVLGKKIQSFLVQEGEGTINTVALSKGIYIANIEFEKGRKTIKLIKK